MQDKKPFNEQGQRHGLWEVYFSNGQLDWKGLFINGKAFGKEESYLDDGNLYYIINFINDEPHGFYEHILVGKEYHAK